MDKEIIKTHLEENNIFLESYIEKVSNHVQEVESFFETRISNIFLNSKLEESGVTVLSSICMFDKRHCYEVHLLGENKYSFDILKMSDFYYANIITNRSKQIPEITIRLDTFGTISVVLYARGIYIKTLYDIYKKILSPYLKSDI